MGQANIPGRRRTGQSGNIGMVQETWLPLEQAALHGSVFLERPQARRTNNRENVNING